MATEFRPDVEGLRAVAVIAVVLFHAQITAFSGGFVGVDVFFVLSGFLITGLLLREIRSTGTISLPRFWARRARRLLPASVLVVVVTMVAARWMLPPLAMRDLAIDALATGVFAVNFVFAHRLGDYFGSQLGQTSPSPLLHFWSLAVEEQFYLFWPALMLVLLRRPRRYMRLLGTVIVVISTLSFIASAWLTDHHPTWAFYLLPARMGELLAGAAVAVGAHTLPSVPATWRAAAAWVGMLGIAVAVLTYDSTTAFPGTATLLPVLSTVLVLIAGGEGHFVYGPSVVLDRQPLLWIGRHSYAIYLWHWPALVLASARFGPLSVTERVVVIALSVALSVVSVQLVENPVRYSKALSSGPRHGLALGGALCATAALAGVIALVLAPSLSTDTVAAAPVLGGAATESPNSAPANSSPANSNPANSAPANAAPSTTAAPANDLASLILANEQVLEQGLATAEVPANLRPALDKVYNDRPALYADGCVAIGVDDVVNACRYGDTAASTKVVLYGDSHAAQWFPPFEEIATAAGFQLIVLTKGGCPTAEVYMPTATLRRTCPIWRDKAIQVIADERPDMVVVSASSHYPNTDEEWAIGFDTTVARLAPLTPRLLVLGDNPSSKTEPAACLSAHLHDVHACTTTRERATQPGHRDAEAQVAARYHATFVDTTDWLCTIDSCPVILGDILIFRDNTHLTTVAATWFRPLIEAAVLPVLKAAPM
ncbi:MAG: hypothetical protein RLZZ623_2950 [Actinomycetota bacterium]